MSETETKGGSPLLTMLAEGFSIPLVGLFALAGVLWGLSQYQFERSSPQPKVVEEEQEEPEDEPERRTTHTEPTGKPIGDVTAKDGLQAIEKGDFQRALRVAKKLRSRMLAERARLFLALTQTIKPGPFATAEALTRITLSSGEVHVGLVQEEADGQLYLELPNGKERKFRLAGIQKRDELKGDARQAALREQLEAARKALTDAGGLALHRLSYLAFSAGLPALGSKFLQEALVGKEGSIIVDMFGGSGFSRLQRARRELAGEPVEPLPIARRPDPDPIEPDPPVGDDDDDPQPKPKPRPTRPDVRVKRTPGTKTKQPSDPLLSESLWKEAERAYRSGLVLYRGSLGKSRRAARISTRAALKEFRTAQEKLGRLANRYGDNYTLGRRQQELAKLVLDCMKRTRLN